jgi:predicted HAD superfamily Cof-like phosphohydrolase
MDLLMIYSITLAALTITIFLTVQLLFARRRIKDLQHEILSSSTNNPWKSQLELMMRSKQAIMPSPQMTKTVMLYGALIIEEAAETMAGIASGVEDVSTGRGSELYRIAVDFAHIARVMEASSKAIRDRIAKCSESLADRQMKIDVAREILDGATDLHVVTAGLSIACGLPGQAAHDRVSTSNLSKANPRTGMIDKDPSGKWIKGPDYREPDLDSLLRHHYAANAV